MKFVRFDSGRTGLVVDVDGLKIVDVAASAAAVAGRLPTVSAAIMDVLPADGSWVPMIGNWDAVRAAFGDLEARALAGDADMILHDYEARRLEPPLAAATTHIFGASSNTAVHVQHAFKVMKNLDLTIDDVMKPKRDGVPPGGFSIWPDLVVGPLATVTAPKGFTKLDYEAECAVYVKNGGRDLDRVDLWGYTAWNDFGVRDSHLGLAGESPWIPFSFNLPKNFDGANACGPWVVVDEAHDPNDLRCRCLVNGEVRQDWRTSDMIYSFDDMLRFISTYQTLRPGDVMMSGTGAGVAIEGGIDGKRWLKPGDLVEIEVDGVGTLANPIGGA